MKTVKSLISRRIDARCVTTGTKKIKDHELETPEYRAWRKIVVERAGSRCQWIEDGQRCQKAAPHHRMVADHIVERADGGALYDPANGQCLCIAHNTAKAIAARSDRLARPSKGRGV